MEKKRVYIGIEVDTDSAIAKISEAENKIQEHFRAVEEIVRDLRWTITKNSSCKEITVPDNNSDTATDGKD